MQPREQHLPESHGPSGEQQLPPAGKQLTHVCVEVVSQRRPEQHCESLVQLLPLGTQHVPLEQTWPLPVQAWLQLPQLALVPSWAPQGLPASQVAYPLAQV
jgi:hypothetical protein